MVATNQPAANSPAKTPAGFQKRQFPFRVDGVRGQSLSFLNMSLTRAVDMVSGGAVYVDPVLAGVLASAESERLPQLTKREREVLRLLADGLSNEEIGKRLFLSPETVRTHVQKAMRRLEADTRTQAVALALRQSLIG